MFHLLLGLTALGASAAVVMAMIAIFSIPLWLGPLVQALIRFFSRGKVARWIPAGFGVIGLVWSIWDLGIQGKWFPIWGICLYWVAYGLLLWGLDTLAGRLRTWVDSRKTVKKE